MCARGAMRDARSCARGDVSLTLETLLVRGGFLATQAQRESLQFDGERDSDIIDDQVIAKGNECKLFRARQISESSQSLK